MSIFVYVPWSEWDLGLSETAYTTEELAWEALETSYKEQFNNSEEPFEEAKKDGLMGVETWSLING